MSNLSDLWYDWLGLNTWLFKKINSLSDVPIYSGIMKLVSILGSERLLPYYIGTIAIFAIFTLIMRIVTEKGGNKYYTIMWVNIFIMLGAGFFSLQHTFNYTKHHFSFPRPYAALPSGSVIQLEGQYPQEANQSFPSKHVAIITLLVIALWPALNENCRWGGIGLIISMAWSRMAMGVHFPMDVISGFFIMLIEMLLLRYIIYGITRRIFMRA